MNGILTLVRDPIPTIKELTVLRYLLIMAAMCSALATAADQHPGRGRGRRLDDSNDTPSPPIRVLTDLTPGQRATIMGIIEDLRRRFPDRPIGPRLVGRRLQTIDPELFALLDRNNNGILDPQELPRRLWQGHHDQETDDADDMPQWRKRVLILRELHPDLATVLGEDVDQIDRAVLRAAWRRYQILLERFDADGDGRLTGAELDRARAAIAAWLQERGPDDASAPTQTEEDDEASMRSQLSEALIERFDRDGDGRLDAAERAAARAELQERLQQRLETLRQEHPDLFAKIDRDGDGEISPEELRLWRQQRQRQRSQQVDESDPPGRGRGQRAHQGQRHGRHGNE